MPIKTFRGLMESSTRERIRLQTNNGKTGYRLIKFQAMPKDPMTLDQENVLKIYKEKVTTLDGEVDFSDNQLLGACCVKYQADVAVSQGSADIIMEREIINQDLYITHDDVGSGNRPCNYYIELEVINLSSNEAEYTTLKDIRNRNTTS